MRILFVNSARPLAGGTTSACDLAAGLSERGHEVTVVVNPDSELLHGLAEHPAVRVAPLRLRSELNAWRAVRLSALLRRIRPDLVLADRRKDVKFSVAARVLLPDSRWIPVIHRHGAPSVLRDSAPYRFIWRRLQGVIVNSMTMRAALLSATPWLEPVGVCVVHNGKDTDRYRPMPELRNRSRAVLGVAPDAFVVCFHGVIQPRKNVDVLIDAVATLAGERSVTALIAGDGPQLPALREIAVARRAPVVFAGMRRDIPHVLAAADVSAHLSSAEGFSNSVIEAMACGLPVIASSASSHPEQIVDGVHGLLVPLRDTPAVAHAIRRLRDDDEGRRRMGNQARDRTVTHFSLATMLDGYEAVFEQAVNRTRN